MGSRPNILIIMVDQLSGSFFPKGPAEFLNVPNLRKLSAGAVNFSRTYCPSPLCSPSRASFMTGLLPSRTGVYDNAAELPSTLPTFAHYLRNAGYKTALSGKMHFVGPDQLHGFEERLTTDIYPSDFGWTPDWSKPDQRIDWWYHNMGSVTGAGVAETSNQLEFDDEVAYHAKLRLQQFARTDRSQPLCLTVSFTHPHDPYVARQKYWDLYPEDTLPLPAVSPIPYEEQDPHSRRIFDANDYRNFKISNQNVIDSRRAYFANISYLDEKIGELLDTLKTCDLEDDTVVLFCADHGDMLGERGLWFKMSFFEGANRVPMFLYAPGRFTARNVTEPTSTLDVLATLVDLAGLDLDDSIAGDGRSLLGLARGERGSENGEDRPVYSEYAAESSIDPMMMIRQGRWKFNFCEVDPPQLFDLEADPLELTDLASDPAHAASLAYFTDQIRAHWDVAAFREEVRRSQARRLVVYDSLRNGTYHPWDFQPVQKASERYMRNHMDLNVLEANARFPRPEG
ncbi:choline-sulfatase [Pelagibius sp. Alg239-R121]|uniref:choline-sulfatase n=1 Tax=Pelagibius sp. Alg239-R121 TaxID=2993448 RepID=UPI0024A79693|nr:choline-sulfatase [Pelagibius sp. Alg239-R121]